jgi:hypothetical protein
MVIESRSVVISITPYLKFAYVMNNAGYEVSTWDLKELPLGMFLALARFASFSADEVLHYCAECDACRNDRK